MKRVVSILLVCLLLVTSVMGCASKKEANTSQPSDSAASSDTAKSSAEADSEASAEKVTLRVSWWGAQARHEVTLKAIEVFEEKYPNITIEPVYGDYDGYFNKLNVELAGNNAPDIFCVDYPVIETYVNNNTLMPLDAYVKDGTLNIDNMDESMVKAGTFNDKYYAVSNGVIAYGILYDETIFDELGMEYPKPDWTWDDFCDIAIEISEKKGEGFYGISDNSKQFNHFEYYVMENGHSLFTEDGKLGATESDLIGWFEMWAKLREAGATPPAEVSVNEGYQMDMRALSLGNAAMDISSSNKIGAYKAVMKNQDHNLNMQTIPFMAGGKRPGVFLSPSQYMGINANSKHPKEAALFLNFMHNDYDGAKIMGYTRGVSCNTEIREKLNQELSDVDKIAAAYVDVVASVGTQQDPPFPPGFTEISDAFATTSESIAFGKLSIEEASKDFIEKANKILDSNK